MTRRWRSWLLLLFVLPLVASAPVARDLPHDAYIWQQRWTQALGTSIDGAKDLVRAWRVLAARADPSGVLRPVEPDWGELTASRRPVVLVIRIDGQLERWDQAALRDAILARLASVPLPTFSGNLDNASVLAKVGTGSLTVNGQNGYATNVPCGSGDSATVTSWSGTATNGSTALKVPAQIFGAFSVPNGTSASITRQVSTMSPKSSKPLT